MVDFSNWQAARRTMEDENSKSCLVSDLSDDDDDSVEGGAVFSRLKSRAEQRVAVLREVDQRMGARVDRRHHKACLAKVYDSFNASGISSLGTDFETDDESDNDGNEVHCRFSATPRRGSVDLIPELPNSSERSSPRKLAPEFPSSWPLTRPFGNMARGEDSDDDDDDPAKVVPSTKEGRWLSNSGKLSTADSIQASALAAMMQKAAPEGGAILLPPRRKSAPDEPPTSYVRPGRLAGRSSSDSRWSGSDSNKGRPSDVLRSPIRHRG